MSLIKCEECGKEISDKAGACPKCGNPMQNINYNRFCTECGEPIEPNDIQCKHCYSILKNNNVYIIDKKTNAMSVAGFVISLVSLCFAFLSILGFIFSCIGLSQVSKRNEKGYGLALAGFIISLLMFMIMVLYILILVYE
ncbi:MAG: DUF4190 domain-containing protein [Bacilli bacterium]|nr:DUF4190 domain-containing protein [Bacilli bacterium]